MEAQAGNAGRLLVFLKELYNITNGGLSIKKIYRKHQPVIRSRRVWGVF